MSSWPKLHKPTKPKREVQGTIVPLVLDFHPMFERLGVLACVKHVFDLYNLEVKHLIGEDTSSAVAYRSTASRLSSVLRKL